MEQNITMEIAQLLLSLLHAWGIDMDLDKVCEGQLGLLRPKLPVSFGVLSKGGEWTGGGGGKKINKTFFLRGKKRNEERRGKGNVSFLYAPDFKYQHMTMSSHPYRLRYQFSDGLRKILIVSSFLDKPVPVTVP